MTPQKNPVMLSSLVQPKAPRVDEPDRYPLQAGIIFVISDFTLSDSRKYGPASIAKINGYDLITKQALKYRTTAKMVIDTLRALETAAGRDANGKLNAEVKVLVAAYRTENGSGLQLVDAA